MPKKKPQHLFERVTLLASASPERLELPVGTTVGECRMAVESKWGWPGGRLLFFGSDAALLWDDLHPLVGGSVIVGRSPWPVTVVLWLPEPTGHQVSSKQRLFLPAGPRATAAEARAKATRLAGLAPQLFEQMRPPEVQGGSPQMLEDGANLEALGLKTMICKLRPPSSRMIAELLRFDVLWHCSKSGRRPPPQDAWQRSGAAPGLDLEGEALENLRRVSAEIAGKANDLVLRSAQQDPHRWHVALRYPVAQSDATWVELYLTFPDSYPATPPTIELLEPLAGARDGEALQQRLSVCTGWTSANTVFCLLGELMDLLALWAVEGETEEADRPVIPRLPLS